MMISDAEVRRYFYHFSLASLVLLVISAALWGRDITILGWISFASVLLSSLYQLYVVKFNPSALQSKNVFRRISLWTPTYGYLLVTANYVICASTAVETTQSVGFETYCVVFSGLWFGLAFVYVVLMVKTTSEGDSSFDDNMTERSGSHDDDGSESEFCNDELAATSNGSGDLS